MQFEKVNRKETCKLAEGARKRLAKSLYGLKQMIVLLKKMLVCLLLVTPPLAGPIQPEIVGGSLDLRIYDFVMRGPQSNDSGFWRLTLLM